ncbi:MAG: arsenate reductase ArsC [Saprospiraceae bacterium]|nr:arsenate reductase ArsC [Saprospiraceae bacterium]
METGGRNILVLCTGNSCRSQMAEAYLKYYSQGLQIFSAGIRADGLNKNMIEVMLEDGIDVSLQTSNTIEEFENLNFECIITVCDHAKESCPLFPIQSKSFHQNFTDPANAKGSSDEILNAFRMVRDEIKQYCKYFIAEYFPNNINQSQIGKS